MVFLLVHCPVKAILVVGSSNTIKFESFASERVPLRLEQVALLLEMLVELARLISDGEVNLVRLRMEVLLQSSLLKHEGLLTDVWKRCSSVDGFRVLSSLIRCPQDTFRSVARHMCVMRASCLSRLQPTDVAILGPCAAP